MLRACSGVAASADGAVVTGVCVLTLRSFDSATYPTVRLTLRRPTRCSPMYYFEGSP